MAIPMTTTTKPVTDPNPVTPIDPNPYQKKTAYCSCYCVLLRNDMTTGQSGCALAAASMKGEIPPTPLRFTLSEHCVEGVCMRADAVRTHASACTLASAARTHADGVRPHSARTHADGGAVCTRAGAHSNHTTCDSHSSSK